MLYPIRIDATSTNQTSRLIDTLLVDPTCLPIPPSSALPSPSSPSKRPPRTAPDEPPPLTLLERTVLQNASYFAATLLADTEVYGVGRTHKNARVRLSPADCPGLRERVEDQIRTQLRIVLKKEEREGFGTTTNRNGGGRNGSGGGTTEGRGEEKKDSSSDDRDRTTADPNLVPVRIRLRTPSVTVLDEFSYDPHHAHSSPLLLARSLASDLSLPPSCINAIAASICEQGMGLRVDGDVEGIVCDEDCFPTAETKKKRKKKDDGDAGVVVKEEAVPTKYGDEALMKGLGKRKAERGIPMAWGMEEKEEGSAQSFYLEKARIGMKKRR